MSVDLTETRRNATCRCASFVIVGYHHHHRVAYPELDVAVLTSMLQAPPW